MNSFGRITSYNVCYTKLLRTYSAKAIINKKGEQLTDFIYYTLNEFKDGIAVASDDLTTFFIRITSYNVCYTKLLRLNP